MNTQMDYNKVNAETIGKISDTLENIVKSIEQLKARVDTLTYKLSETEQDVVNTENRISRLTICN